MAGGWQRRTRSGCQLRHYIHNAASLLCNAHVRACSMLPNACGVAIAKELDLYEVVSYGIDLNSFACPRVLTSASHSFATSNS